uniref:MULE transposase domain-containing protein n=1 Tax=Lactuca sativa TaxID=4236 RepID=A0A9R1XUP9_LACSA|nr:hypothetical protein LSAT_V11C100024430 [Lactuca sativa]
MELFQELWCCVKHLRHHIWGARLTRSYGIQATRKSNPKIPVKALHEELMKKLELGMSLQKVARTKTMIELIVSGDYQLLNTNPGTTVRMNVYPETSLCVTTKTIRRIYVCLCAFKMGFKVGLRDFLRVDGTFLKGPYHGQVLTVVGMDSNNEYTIQKRIIPAFKKVFPNAEHRFCLRHIQENMKKQWKGKDLSDQLWECGRATIVNHFNITMDELKKISEEDRAWVCRAHTDCLLNNLCKVFNSKLDEDKYEGLLTPTTTIMFDNIKTNATKYVAKYNGAGKYQVLGDYRFSMYTCFLCYGTELKMEKMPHMLMNRSILAIGYQHGKPYISTKLIHLMDVQCGLKRHKKKRMRGVDEPNNQAGKLTRKYLTVTCSKCHNKGHNPRTRKG